MTTEAWWHVAEIVFIGTPVWTVAWVAIRAFIIFREFPPHRHDNGHILYPTGYEPGRVQNVGGRTNG